MCFSQSTIGVFIHIICWTIFLLELVFNFVSRRAVEILEALGTNSSEGESMWTRLSQLALESQNFRVAER